MTIHLGEFRGFNPPPTQMYYCYKSLNKTEKYDPMQCKQPLNIHTQIVFWLHSYTNSKYGH